ncbi:unnamed protein product [Spirodela intermedia]|uniref:Uncharacterized protein n=1 Tax=Spirodela intermedia TaxID=51605 RepID=A0A811G7F0_SPIIN|nr:unnamed protein product [Spirodela intermedia]
MMDPPLPIKHPILEVGTSKRVVLWFDRLGSKPWHRCYA